MRPLKHISAVVFGWGGLPLSRAEADVPPPSPMESFSQHGGYLYVGVVVVLVVGVAIYLLRKSRPK